MRNILITIATLFVALPAFAADGETNWVKFGVAIALGIAAFGGAIAQSNAAKSGLEGIARNPSAQDKIFTPLILSLVFIETLVLFTFTLAFVL